MKACKTQRQKVFGSAVVLALAASSPVLGAEMKFSSACAEGQSIVVGAVGDILLHSPLQRQGQKDPQGFRSLWKGVAPLLEKADLQYGNLEGPASSAHEADSKFPTFNYDPALIEDLKQGGFDVVSTANNHSMDKGGSGVDSTIRKLDQVGLPFTGTRASSALKRAWGVITETSGVRVGWVACTESTNGIRDPKQQTLMCYSQKSQVIAEIKRLRKAGADAVIVTPHWGSEYKRSFESRRESLGVEFLKAGALAVLGSHPHMVQPWKKYVIDGQEKFILYSLGNFVSAQFFGERLLKSYRLNGRDRVALRTSLILYLGLTKTSSGKVVLNGVRYVPTYMSSGGGRVNLVPVDAASFSDKAIATSIIHEVFPKENQISSKSKEIVTNPECS